MESEGTAINASVTDLEKQLNDFDPALRERALRDLVALSAKGEVALPSPAAVANMHCHTFYSFNAYGHSPASLAWLARRRGLELAGIVDFDVLDGVDEFMAACDVAAVRGTAGIETRVFVPEYASREINSPGEPGVAYHMGIGFTNSLPPAPVAPLLADLSARAAQRNQAMIERINAHLPAIAVDYARDVLPLTPNGHPTERHILAAYLRKAEQLPDPAGFWAGALGQGREQIVPLLTDVPKLQNLVRSKLMKRGGVGYVQPDAGSFPTVADFHRLITACGALPCVAWLDGTSVGEDAADELLAFWVSQGAVALNIIPDRNWNIADPNARALKVRKLYQVVEQARAHDLPLNVGTEMNAFGQKVVDDFDAPELAPVRQAFLEGARWVYGHTALQRALGLGYSSPWALKHLPSRRARNAFYTAVGSRVQPGTAGLAQLRQIGATVTPDDLLKKMGARA